MFTVYIWIDGPDFDPDAFQKKLDPKLRGKVELRKRMNQGKVERFGKYWKSKAHDPVEDDPTPNLATSLREYRDALLHARAMGASRVVAEVVAEFGSVDEARGVFLSNDVIALLAECQTALDIDIVRRL